jgi:pilus assembly protein Flp/PilA
MKWAVGAEAMTSVLLMWPDRRGATAIEYAIIASLISIAIVAAVQGLGITLQGTFSTLSDAF